MVASTQKDNKQKLHSRLAASNWVNTPVLPPMTDKVKTIPCWMTSVTGPQAFGYDQHSSSRSPPSLLSSRFKKTAPKRCVSMCPYVILSDTHCSFKVVSGKGREDEKTRTRCVIGFDNPVFLIWDFNLHWISVFLSSYLSKAHFSLAISFSSSLLLSAEGGTTIRQGETQTTGRIRVARCQSHAGWISAVGRGGKMLLKPFVCYPHDMFNSFWIVDLLSELLLTLKEAIYSNPDHHSGVFVTSPALSTKAGRCFTGSLDMQC